MIQSAQESSSKMPGYAVPILFFNISDVTAGAELSWIREIVTARRLTRVPNANDFVSGVVNIRGEVISVLDTSALCFGRKSQNHSRIILLDTRDAPLGLAVDNVSAVHSVLPESFTTADQDEKHGIPPEYISGVTIFEGSRTPLLDIPALLKHIHKNFPHFKEATE